MAAYVAAAILKTHIKGILHYIDVQFPPSTLKIIKFAERELISFQNFVDRVDRRSRKTMSASLAQIEEAITNYTLDFGSRLSLHLSDEENEDLSRGIHSLVEKMKKVEEEFYALPEDEKEVVSSSIMVGLRDQRIQLKEQLVTTEKKFMVISLLGMAGIGKTALAREIFEDLDISEWFDCRAWVAVGKREYMEIFRDIVDLVDTDTCKRYLIVLDDIWDESVCSKLAGGLRQTHGSRFLLTSSIRFQHTKFNPRFFEVRLLDKDESWDLLRDKVFSGGDPCPPQLVDVGKKIAEKCDGLPLTILTVADLLSEAGKTSESLWIDVAEKSKHQLFVHAYDKISKVLSPSYKELGDDIKFYLLYMGVFPLKYEIPTSKLVNLLIAEEIVDTNIDSIFKPPELTHEYLISSARFFLMELYYRSLVMVYQKSTYYYQEKPHEEGMKTCGLHSSWWHFCQREARKTNFFRVIDCPEDSLEEVIKDQSRLSMHNNVLFSRKDVYDSMEKNCASTAQSLLCFGPYHPYQVPVCFALKLLQRLDFVNIRFYDFPLEVLELVMLCYLALTCNGNLPPSISELRKLQFLIVHPHLSIKSSGAPSYMPMEVWNLEELRHLQVTGRDLPDLGDASLQNLSTLSDVTTDSCIVLKRAPNLLKLGIRIELTPDATEPIFHFDHISHLTNMESIKCVIVNPKCNFMVVSPVVSFPCLPSSLQKLSLCGLGFPWNEMSKIASLPNLEVLKLRYNAFRGPEWEVDESGFQNLCTLQIEDDDLVIMKGAPGSFKKLWDLRIKHCYKLEELHLGNFEKIRKIEIIDCNPLVEMKIKEAIVLYPHFQPSSLKVDYSWKS